jgi:energy-coupling factor transport system substrate-specific component
MSTTVMDHDRTSGMWEITSRTIVYAAIGAALYAVLAQIQFPLPGTANVSLRPGFAIVTFFGFAFGPIVGLFTGLVGNAIADQLSGWGLLTSWNWSLANGLVGLLAGVLGVSMAGSIKNRYVLAAVASVIAVAIGFLFVFTDMVIGSADSFGTALTANYLPVVIGNAIVAGILTPILVAAWDPIKDSLGR